MAASGVSLSILRENWEEDHSDRGYDLPQTPEEKA
jgi:hypothetical protein